MCFVFNVYKENYCAETILRLVLVIVLGEKLKISCTYSKSKIENSLNLPNICNKKS